MLNQKELIEYKKHPVYGYTALKNENWISKKSKEMILCHHERIDGSGYPLHATNISIDTKIINVCDTFDEYICGIGRRKMKIHEAVEYMKVNAPSYLAASTSFNVFWNCSSVSLGKPTIISVVKAKSGTNSFNLCTFDMYCSKVYLRFIFFKM